MQIVCSRYLRTKSCGQSYHPSSLGSIILRRPGPEYVKICGGFFLKMVIPNNHGFSYQK